MAFFPEVEKIRHEGPDSTSPLRFRHNNPDEKAEGRPMREHLRFAVAYWHTRGGRGLDNISAPSAAVSGCIPAQSLYNAGFRSIPAGS